LRAHAREEDLGAAGGERRAARIIPVRYRAGPDEPGPHRMFDFSTAALGERWAAGYGDMVDAISSTAP
jgi:NTE family protein